MKKGSTSIKENIHSIMNGTELSLQSFVDDIPFEFNHKYRTIILVSLCLIKKIRFYLFVFY
jgi:hypothetical protein